LDAQVLHAAVALDAVAGAAQQLQVLDVVGPAFAPGDDVVDLEVAGLEVLATPGAVAGLLAVERLRVRAVGWELALLRVFSG